jgi:hypothetical protein
MVGYRARRCTLHKSYHISFVDPLCNNQGGKAAGLYGAVKRRSKNDLMRHPTPHATHPIHRGYDNHIRNRSHDCCGVCQSSGFEGETHQSSGTGAPLLAVLKPNRIICKRTDANCSSFHLRVFLGLSNPRDRGRLSLYLYRMITLVKEKLSLTKG